MHKLCSKSKLGRSIEGILFAPDKMVATDSFRLLEVKKKITVDKPVVMAVKGFSGTGDNIIVNKETVVDGKKHLVAFPINDQFPIYESIIPKTKPVFEMTVDAKLFGELLLEQAKHQPGISHVKLSFYGTNKVIKSVGKDTMGLTMPVYTS